MRRWLLLAAALSLASTVRAQDYAATHQEIARLTQCFAREMRLGGWEIRVNTIVAPDTAWAGRTAITPRGEERPLAEIDYELAWISAAPERAHVAVRHEMLHVVTAELFVSLHQYDPELAVNAAEWVVRRIASWELWSNVCQN